MQENDAARINTLFLDAGGVLLFPNWRRVCAALKKRGDFGILNWPSSAV
jgi:hypothetical protein